MGNRGRSIVYLTRHGARIDNEDHRWLSNCSHKRHDDPHLSPAGNVGADELARRMKDLQHEEGWKTLHIISSPYIRCIETANAVAQILETTIKVEVGIAEVNSSHNPGFLDATELKQQFPLVDTSYAPAIQREELGLEYSDGACAQRSSKAARIVADRLMDGEKNEDESSPILFVGHGASCLGIAGQFGRSGYVGYTSLSKFTRDEDSARWKCDYFGNVEHLSDKQTSLNSAW